MDPCFDVPKRDTHVEYHGRDPSYSKRGPMDGKELNDLYFNLKIHQNVKTKSY